MDIVTVLLTSTIVVAIIVIVLSISTQPEKFIGGIDYDHYDYVVVGTGVTGLYAVRSLLDKYKRVRILLIDKMNRIGGRLYSSTSAGSSSSSKPLELGGQRFFPSIHTNVQATVNKYGLHDVKVPYVGSENKMFLRGRLYNSTKSNNPAFNRSYVLRLDTATDNIDQYVNERCIVTDSFANEDINDIKVRQKVFADPFINSIRFIDIMRSNLNSEIIKLYLDRTGYSSLFARNIHYGIAIVENIALNNRSTEQKFLKDGYASLPGAIYGSFKTMSPQKIRTINNVYLHTVDTTKDMIQISISKVQTPIDDPEIIPDIDTNMSKITCRKLIMTCKPNELQHITFTDPKIDEKAKNLKNYFDDYNAIKIFIKFNKPFGEEFLYGLARHQGRDTVDLPIRQVWYWDVDTILLYTCYEDALFFKELCPYKMQATMISADKASKLVNAVMLQLEEYDQTLKTGKYVPESVAWSYWDSGENFWASHMSTNLTELQKDIVNFTKNCYVLGSHVSFNQGWVEGCFESVNQVIGDL